MSQSMLHFSVGPVQGFVAQARRTRDLWAGSFLLSYLAGQAMHQVLGQGGSIHFPQVHNCDRIPTDPLLQAIAAVHEQQPLPNPPPTTGSLPNRFVAYLPAGKEPVVIADALRKEWQNIADAVWREYVAPIAQMGHNSKTIWDRQVPAFWEINWVAGDDPTLLDQRKHWRSHVPTNEPGDKCTMMSSLQELSGHAGNTRQGREQQKRFWSKLRRRVGDLNLNEDERLCAIALIKRLFPLVGEETIGWEVPQGYPSTVYLAAAPWVADRCREEPEAAAAYARAVLAVAPGARVPSALPGVEAAVAEHPEARAFGFLDGNCYFPSALQNPRLCRPDIPTGDREELSRTLKVLTDRGGSPSPYYVLLLMDGDHLGALLSTQDPQAISAALADFTREAGRIVPTAGGRIVYAGGDDVMALFPLPSALDAAVRLRRAYRRAMAAHLPASAGDPTISAAILYAHCRSPLQQVARWAHQLLADEAKDATGRDGLAVGLWQGGGPTLTWAAPWPVLLDEKYGEESLLHRLVQTFTGDEATGRGFSATFFHNLRRQYDLLENPENEEESVPGLEPEPVLLADYLRSREPSIATLDLEEARMRIRQLLLISRRYRRPDPEGPHRAVGRLRAEGALLVKFLAQRGAGE